ncbi:Dihydrolipoamide succinyltransferase [Daphnia sinensis]|uniref:Dihydrolipoamide acetyltransferase component of pyruvate dehydrogenase complex n=1 Tax=Daphnia sinensis TaxID=1820382 RepID=A0AAD5PKJ5_9CRUS|nr:Dihydrolipoamide succinyltransferase [Daphnia sinensis]
MGESVAEATIIKWVKQPGDNIEIDESVLEIATDKVDSEVPSPVSGKLVKVLFKEDEVVQVGAVIAIIETDANAQVIEESPKESKIEQAVKVEEVQSTPSTSNEIQTPKSVASSTSVSGGDEIIEMDRMRKLIADHMVMSKQTSAHVTSFVEADVTNLVKWRDRVKAVAKAIKDLPMINISINGTQIIKKRDINIGMAAALPSGNLIVPVIKNADQLNLFGLTKAVNDLANRARQSKLKPDETQGGTFTLTNVGTFGNVMGTPIINQPQVAILAVGAIKKKPAVLETENGDVIAIRHMMFLSLSYDHRVVDGSLEIEALKNKIRLIRNKNSILFVGSSSFTMWKDVQNDFPAYQIINRGFGGSSLTDVIRYAPDIIYPYQPKQFVIYCGENDFVSSPNANADTVFKRFSKLFGMIRKEVPKAHIVFISIKPSPSRAKYMPEMVRANAMIQSFLKKIRKLAM